MSCDSCTNKELAQQFEKVLQQAKDYAVTNQVNTIIYKSDEGQWSYIEANAGRDAGIIPVQFVSKLRPVTS